MSVVVAVLLGCTALASAVCARVAFRLALLDGAGRTGAWGAAGAAAMAVITDVCTVAATLELGDGHPRASRVAVTVVTVALALFLGFVAYDVTGPAPAPAAGPPAAALSRPKRLASAATAFTSTFIVLALVLPLLN
ncbi:hypothetical protein [Streptomyces sp. NRRL B-1347]|uniref:hypothetical protein n=1 Tax=Streptomyces sp. NRRL B-1347 TaxID=1476877 RepID=UPI0004C94D74|nr:hypothetical protein [Streptomyces sp. NRRL B-1347]